MDNIEQVETVNDRVKKFYTDKKLSQEEFSDRIGASQQYISAIVNNKRTVGPNIINKMKAAFPELDMYWLLNGGENKSLVKAETLSEIQNLAPEEMKVSEPFEQFAIKSKNGHQTFNMPDGSFMMRVPLIAPKAYGRYISEGDSAEHLEGYDYVYFKVSHVGKGKYRAFEIKGDSMDSGLRDDTPDKALVLGREVGKHLWPSGFHDSQYGFVIVTNNNIVFKDIIDFDKNTGIIICHSRNPSKEYSDFPLSLDEEVHTIFKVITRQF